METIHIRNASAGDAHELADLICVSLNFWYQTHARPPILPAGSHDAEIFFEVYNHLDPGCALVAESQRTGRLMGSCFYHPREHHVSLGIMNVHPNYFGRGVARALLQRIIDVSDQMRKPLRLTQSAMNLDSFSLYTQAGFVPRYAYQDMFLKVPETGIEASVPGVECVRAATLDDVLAMAALEFEVSGITREPDYRYCIENRAGFWHAAVHQGSDERIDGFMISSLHPGMNMLGPCVARDDRHAAALILRELDIHRGRSPVFLVPVDRGNLVRWLYDIGARNCELHFCQVRGDFQPFRGINMPTFLPETG
jgi:GNAT superfamily N-acetyltransferase